MINSSSHEVEKGNQEILWNYPNIGTCGEPIDLIQIVIMRVRAIPDIYIGFDGERNGFTIQGWFKKGEEDEMKEVAFIPENDLEWERFES